MMTEIEEIKRQLKSSRMLTEEQASQMFGISKCTLRCWRNKRRGPRYFKNGRRIRYRPEDIDAYLVGQPVETVDSLKQQEG